MRKNTLEVYLTWDDSHNIWKAKLQNGRSNKFHFLRKDVTKKKKRENIWMIF